MEIDVILWTLEYKATDVEIYFSDSRSEASNEFLRVINIISKILRTSVQVYFSRIH